MRFDPKISFWLGVFVTALIGIGGGTVSLTHAVPPDWIPTVVGATSCRSSAPPCSLP